MATANNVGIVDDSYMVTNLVIEQMFIKNSDILYQANILHIVAVPKPSFIL